jgi:uncharacterized protein HemY
MRTSTMTLKALALLTVTTVFTACEDIPKQASKPATTRSVVAETPKTPDMPVPPPVTATPVKPPENTPEIKKEDPIARKVINDSDEGDDSDNATLTDLMSRTRDALTAGDTGRALKLAARTVQKAPKRSSAWNLLGRAQLQAGKRALAMASFEKAVELNPNNSYAQNNLGLTLIYDQKYDDAIEALEAATEAEPVEGFMWNNLGMAYEHVDRLDDARDAYRKAAEKDNDYARESLARLEGVRSVMRTAKVDREPKGGAKAGEPTAPPSSTQ